MDRPRQERASRPAQSVFPSAPGHRRQSQHEPQQPDIDIRVAYFEKCAV